jgi:hypothetical protein
VVHTGWNLDNFRSRAKVHYILKEFEHAVVIAQELKEVDWETFRSDPEVNRNIWHVKLWAEGLLGACYARLGMRTEALAQVAVLE